MPNTTPPPQSAVLPGTKILDGRYVLKELLEEEQAACGAPAVWRVEGPSAACLAKAWRIRGDDQAVRAVWNHELRNLLKLEGIPKSRSHFASLEALGIDVDAYYIVIDSGDREQLSAMLLHRAYHPWLRDISQAAVRARLWEGLATVASALAMLHEHGLLHRALRPECVFTDVAGDCDFVLSGFEWSLRLNASAIKETLGSGPTRLRAPELLSDNPAYSMASDWFDFGLLAAELLSDVKATGNDLSALHELRVKIDRSRLLKASERQLLFSLLTPNPDERRLACNGVARQATAIARQISVGEKSFNDPLLLAVQLGPSSELSAAICSLTGRRIAVGDVAAQLDFIKADLGGVEPSVTARSAPRQSYSMQGKQLAYSVDKFGFASTAPSWRAGLCRKPDRGSHDRGLRHGLYGRPIEVHLARNVEPELRKPGARWMRWDRCLPFDQREAVQAGDDLLAFLKFTNHVDALMTAAQVWPVTVVEHRSLPGDEWIAVDAATEEDRDDLARALGMDVPARQMELAFFDEIGPIDGDTRFHLTDRRGLVRTRDAPATWAIMNADITPQGGRRYWFRLAEGHSSVEKGLAYLRPKSIDDTIRLQERRHSAIEALREQRIMLQAIEAPGSVTRNTLDPLDTAHPDISGLDNTKRKAIAEIWCNQPLYALQGPPGTGKTVLVETLIAHALQRDSSLQFLATAQANETVDGLAVKLAKKIGKRAAGNERALLVRLDKRTSSLAPEAVAIELSGKLANSPLARAAPAHIKERIADLRQGSGQKGKRERRDLEHLVSRAANVVMSTTTSKSLSNLIDDRKRFDWCVLEEAGKAHGFELALPMLASHRMLMIGDHEQLPAFNDAAFLRLLQEPEKVESALVKGAAFIPRRLGFDLGPQESEEDKETFEDLCLRWRPMVRLFADLFENSYRQVNADGSQRVALAERLNEQHRMHPDICGLIRDCFYPDLRTAEAALARLAEPDPFELARGTWLPSERIVFVDVPYVQGQRGARGQDTGPRGRLQLSSHTEANAVVDVIAELRAKDRCELQVLTPYNDQLKLLRRTINNARYTGRLDNLDEFAIPAAADQIGATVHGFQGGEADIVIVSLVRNNHASPRGGVGFLSDRALLNVMLSRAKRKLILVGSWQFFKKRVTAEALDDEHDRLHHVARVFHELEKAMDAGIARLCPLPGRKAVA